MGTVLLLFFVSLSAQAFQPKSITGTVKDDAGQPLPGVTVLVKGTNRGTVTNADGNYTLTNVPAGATMVYSFIGMTTQEVKVENLSTINVTMATDAIGIEEVVAVGYGMQKKVNLTGAVSIATAEEIEERPVATVQQALQGLVPNLNISVSGAGGEPGASMNMNIRGLSSFSGNTSPYVLVDGIPMDINDIDPNDIESISVLKDAASSAIYGARAANGVILITTKTGKDSRSVARVSYTTNFAFSSPLNLPEMADPMTFALAMNDAAKNTGITPWYSADALDRLAKNIASPGSAPVMYGKPDGLTWDIGAMGLGAAAVTDWYGIYFKNFSTRQKHNLSVSGTTGKIDYYLSTGYYDEQGLFKAWEDSYNRFNFDGKISSQATPWLKISALFKYNYDKQDFPWAADGRGRIYDLITKIKPTMPEFYPNYPAAGVEGDPIPTQEGNVQVRRNTRDVTIGRQVVLSPRISLEPVKGWVTNVEVNYILNNDRNEKTSLTVPWVRPNGAIAYSPTKETTRFIPMLNTNEYLSPSVYSTYTRSFGKHNVSILAGYQQEVYKYFNLTATADYLLSDAIPSVSTAVGTKTVSDGQGHWATQSAFGRLTYNFDEKYFLEANYRADGSSRFEPGEQWGNFPSFSTGWVLSKESFFPLKKQIDFFKIRASYGSLGNQNVSFYLYVPTMPISQSLWLFGNKQLWTVGTPNLTSIDLTWEKVSTFDIGADFRLLDDRLSGTFDWYEAYTTDLVGPGTTVPAVLGASVPRTNSGEIRTRGWDLELSFKNNVQDFYYEIGGVLSDNISIVTKYNNPTLLLNTFYEGQKLGDLWGYESAGLFQTAEEVAGWADQQAVYAGTWRTGDVKYVDQNDDKKVNFGKNTLDDHGDLKVMGNERPRFSYGFNLAVAWKGFDLAAFFQGIGKLDLWISESDNGNYFRGNANGPLHATVLKEHKDYWRDDTSPLGANPDAYFAKPYSVFTGENQKNYQTPNNRYMQNGAYLRMKNLQLGYTIPKSITQKVNISNVKIYVSGENLFTVTKLMLFDPEATVRGGIGDAKIYPLAKAYSVGLNINF